MSDLRPYVCPFMRSGATDPGSAKAKSGERYPEGAMCIGEDCALWVETFDESGCAISVGAINLTWITANTQNPD